MGNLRTQNIDPHSSHCWRYTPRRWTRACMLLRRVPHRSRIYRRFTVCVIAPPLRTGRFHLFNVISAPDQIHAPVGWHVTKPVCVQPVKCDRDASNRFEATGVLRALSSTIACRSALVKSAIGRFMCLSSPRTSPECLRFSSFSFDR